MGFWIERSYREPYRQECAAMTQALEGAAEHVDGSEARIARILDQYASFKDYDEQLKQTLGSRNFLGLPRLTHGSQIIDYCHVLQCGAYRGIFLVSADGEDVVALLFSRAPHRTELLFQHITDAFMKGARKNLPRIE